MITAIFLALIYVLFFALTAVLPDASTYPLPDGVSDAFQTAAALLLAVNRYLPMSEMLYLFGLSFLVDFWLLVWQWVRAIMRYLRGN